MSTHPGKGRALSLFREMSKKGGACEAAWYGEVFTRTPTQWPSTAMGSGQFASSGLGSAAYVRLPFYADAAGVSTYPVGPSFMGPRDDACYTRSDLLTNAKGEPYFFLGGPGGDGVTCK